MSDQSDPQMDYTFTLTQRQVRLLKDLVDTHLDSDVPDDDDLEDLTHLQVELTRGPNVGRD